MKGTNSPSGHFGEEKHFLPPPRFEPQTVQSSCYTDYATLGKLNVSFCMLQKHLGGVAV